MKSRVNWVKQVIPCLLGITFLGVATLTNAYAQSGAVKKEEVARRPVGFETSEFTGEVLPVFYVRDVLKSVTFYVDSLGFVCHHFFDHITGGSTLHWTYDEPPLYAEMRAGNQKFALHRASKPDSLQVSGCRHYFSVANVQEHYRILKEKGVKVGELIERPWMHMFRVEDPDGHEIFIFTRPEESDQN